MKRKWLSKLCCVFTTLLFIVCYVTAGQAQANDKKAILKACTKLFGPTVDAEQNLFEVSQSYVLQLRFGEHDELTDMFVNPKHTYEESHPEWTEPETPVFMPMTEYGNLLARLDQIKDKGQLIKSVASLVITNSTHHYLDQYENAFLSRGMRGDEGLRGFSLAFYRQITGKVNLKRMYDYSGGVNRDYYAVVVDGCSYFTKQSEFRRLELGRTQSFLAVPAKWLIFDGFSMCEDE